MADWNETLVGISSMSLLLYAVLVLIELGPRVAAGKSSTLKDTLCSLTTGGMYLLVQVLMRGIYIVALVFAHQFACSISRPTGGAYSVLPGGRFRFLLGIIESCTKCVWEAGRRTACITAVSTTTWAPRIPAVAVRSGVRAGFSFPIAAWVSIPLLC